MVCNLQLDRHWAKGNQKGKLRVTQPPPPSHTAGTDTHSSTFPVSPQNTWVCLHDPSLLHYPNKQYRCPRQKQLLCEVMNCPLLESSKQKLNSHLLQCFGDPASIREGADLMSLSLYRMAGRQMLTTVPKGALSHGWNGKEAACQPAPAEGGSELQAGSA